MSISLSPADFESLQTQLLTLKTELYETREREVKANKAKEALGKELEQVKATIANVNTNGATAAAGAAHTDTESNSHEGESSSAPSSSASSTLSNILNTVKRNSVNLSNAISQVAPSSSSPSLSATSASASTIEKLERELFSLRSQSANDAEESSAQITALKMNIQHLHKRAQDLEKQNATLMTHLSNLEEERQSLNERRERELRKRQARQQRANSSSSVPLVNEETDDLDEDEDDIDKIREQWKAVKSRFETKLTALQTELATKDVAISQLRTQLTDEQTNFERLLTKMGEKDDQLRHEREENHRQQQLIRDLKVAAATNTSPLTTSSQLQSSSTSSSPMPMSSASPMSPQKSPSSFRNFLNKITDTNKDKDANPPSTPSKSSTTTTITSQSDVSSSPSLTSTAPSSSSSAAVDPLSAPATAPSSIPPAPLSPSSPSPPPEVPQWSPSQSLDDQVTSLQSELCQLKILNEHLITSVSKKDASIRAIQDDCERVMSKLAEKEMQIHSLRESASQLENVLKEMKRKDTLILKLHGQVTQLEKAAAGGSSSTAGGSSVSGNDSTSSSSSSSTAAELKAALDAIQLAHSEYDALKETLENTKDMLFLAETQLIDKQKLLTEQQDTISDLRSSQDANERTIENLLRQKSKMESDLNEHVDYLEKKCLTEVKEWETKYDDDIQRLESELQSKNERIIALQSEVAKFIQIEKHLKNELDELQQTYSTLQTNEAELRTTHGALESQFAELQSSILIETRKRNTIVNELREELKKELIKSKELTAKLKSAEDDIVALKVMNQHQIAASSTGSNLLLLNGHGMVDDMNNTGGSVQSDGSSASAGGVGDSSNSSSAYPNSVASGPSSNHPHPHHQHSTSGTHSKGVEQEVTVALAQKLAELQNDKHLLLKQKRSLEEHLDLLTNDVAQKKEMIRNLVRRIETGALSTNEQDGGMQKTNLFGTATLTQEAKQELFDKMEIILQETTLQNAQYKKNLKSMGEEITKLMEESVKGENDQDFNFIHMTAILT